jgi:leader peptidase (prepilin peptidase)/N-methyltransferase
MVDLLAAAGTSSLPDWFTGLVVFAMGSIVGSFLNVCIYRMPRNESIVHPRSHCPQCNAPISWQHNIPLVSYIALRGRTLCCGRPYSIRYWIIELVTASSFLLLWNSFDPAVAICYMVFVALMIVATCTDLEHFIIPDEITYGGIVAGLICSALVPQLQSETSHLRSFGMSLAGGVTAWLLLWGIVELGKLAFGKKRVRFAEPTQMSLNSTVLRVGDEELPWEDVLSRVSDRLEFSGTQIALKMTDGSSRSWDQAKVTVTQEGFAIGDESFPFDKIDSLTCLTSEVVIPREAMGFGDVKFIGGIGAFLGPSSLFFIVLVSSLVGSLVGILMMLLNKRDWGGKLPYGPYLALAAVLWIFFGLVAPDLAASYHDMLHVMVGGK